MTAHRVLNDIDLAAQVSSAAPGRAILFGTTVPTDASTGYGKGCLFVDRDASGGAQLYINEGSVTSCDFNAIVSVNTAKTDTANNTFSGTNTVSGSVSFTGNVASAGGVLLVTSANCTSRHRFTIAASRDAGKTIVFTSGNNTSRHNWVMLPFASTLTGGGSGMIIRFINNRAVNTSGGITFMTSAAAGKQLNGTSRPFRATSRVVNGGATLLKANNRWFILHRDYGGQASSIARGSLAWLTV